MFWAIYKKKQGLIVRWSSFGIASLLFIYGGYRLYYFLSQWEWATKFRWMHFLIPVFDVEVVVDPRFVISLVGTIAFVWFFYFLCMQQHRVSEFLIDTESEMRKVSWPTLVQVIKSCIAVVMIVLILGLYLYVVDGLLNEIFCYIF